MLALLEAVGGGDPVEIFRRAVEKELRGALERSRRLRDELALAADVAGPIIAETLASLSASTV